MMDRATKSNFSTDGGGGWDWILSDLKSLIETGKTMSGRTGRSIFAKPARVHLFIMQQRSGRAHENTATESETWLRVRKG